MVHTIFAELLAAMALLLLFFAAYAIYRKGKIRKKASRHFEVKKVIYERINHIFHTEKFFITFLRFLS